jgi:hypothetical protein
MGAAEVRWGEVGVRTVRMSAGTPMEALEPQLLRHALLRLAVGTGHGGHAGVRLCGPVHGAPPAAAAF